VNYFTAYFAYWEAGFLTGQARGNRVLIHAVAGGVGTAAVQIGKILGAEMYGTSSTDDKLARVKDLGLQNAINYKERDYEEAIKEMTGGEGVDAAFEMLGGEHTAKSIRCLRDFGKVIQYGTATGKQPQLDLRALYAKAASVQGLWLTYLSSKHDLMEQAWKHLSQWIAEDKLRPVIGHVVAANEAAKGYELLMARKNFGKVVLKIA
jgi:NADPH2:quinone reductase